MMLSVQDPEHPYALFFVQKIPVEPVVANVLKFDILLPEIVLANTPRFVLYILHALSISRNLGEIIVWQSTRYIFLKSETTF